MNLIEILILAIIQGITEWLPISSSGHLVLVQQFSGLSAPVFFDVILHVGTLIVVLIVFRDDIVRILKAVARLDFKGEEGKLALYIVVGSIPTAIIGFLFQDAFESLFTNIFAVGIAFIGTGTLLYFSELRKKRNLSLNHPTALLIGTAQGLALIPGVSRSGTTISTGLLLRVKKEEAFQFSFLLYIPAVIGATLAEGVREWRRIPASNIDVSGIFFGLLVTILVGYVFLRLLLQVVLKEKFHIFAYYCWVLGTLIVVTQIM